jgi:transcriptional regulator with GAF, ATPase, and Fis domain
MATDPPERRRLTEAGAAFTAYLDFDEVLRRVLPYAAEAAGAEAACLFLHDGEPAELVVAAAGGPAGESSRGRRFADAEGTAGAVLQSARPHLVADAEREASGLDEADRVSGLAVRSLMAVPLKIGSRVLGVVEAVNRIGGGAFEPVDLERFVSACGLVAVAVENAGLYRQLARKTEILERSREDESRPLVAESDAMRRAVTQAERAAVGRSTVLLVGETGTGKEQVARLIHDASPRARGPFVALNCGALPEGLLESELFGHEKGSFTGADRRRIGRFELADGGTLFLDEIGELPAGAQVKLLRVLQEHEVTRVGGAEPVRVDVRLIAATHRDLPTEVRAGRFREDLFFRVHVVPVRLPALRHRPEDIEPLATLFLDRFARELGRSPRSLTPEGLDRLRAHRWPGNVRELENLMERLLVLGDEGPIDAAELGDLLMDVSPRDPPSGGLKAGSLKTVEGSGSLWEQEQRMLVQALERAGQNQSRAARLLKISREQLRTRMKRYGLLPPRQ